MSKRIRKSEQKEPGNKCRQTTENESEIYGKDTEIQEAGKASLT